MPSLLLHHCNQEESPGESLTDLVSNKIPRLQIGHGNYPIAKRGAHNKVVSGWVGLGGRLAAKIPGDWGCGVGDSKKKNFPRILD